ncbi:MAG: DinB family protein [Ignavibacteriales bacterium]|nr:DinB family protein [Ignavibacteriales bacterium]
MNRPEKNEYAEYYHKYVEKVPQGNIVDILDGQLNSIVNFFSQITEEKSKHRYAPGKWSIKGVLGHIMDAERVFAYRALRFSRGDEKPLLTFDENQYVANSTYDSVPLHLLVEEFSYIRKANIHMFKNLSDEMWMKKGIASNNPVSVRALAYIIAGHTQHHINIIEERYL